MLTDYEGIRTMTGASLERIIYCIRASGAVIHGPRCHNGTPSERMRPARPTHGIRHIVNDLTGLRLTSGRDGDTSTV